MMILLALGLVTAMADCDVAIDRADHAPVAQYCLAAAEVTPESYDSDVRSDENPEPEVSGQ